MANRSNRLRIGCIRNVHAIPRYQEIHSVHRCDRDVGLLIKLPKFKEII
jgi:hypothetical protein